MWLAQAREAPAQAPHGFWLLTVPPPLLCEYLARRVSSPLDFTCDARSVPVFKPSDPLGWRRNRLLRRRSRIGTARALEAADCANGHIVITDDLTRQPNAAQASRNEPLLLCGGPVCRLSSDELHTAGGAARKPAARVHDIDPGILLDREHEAFVLGDFERSISFDG